MDNYMSNNVRCSPVDKHHSQEREVKTVSAYGLVLTERELPILLLDFFACRVLIYIQDLVRAGIRLVQILQGNTRCVRTYLSLKALRIRSTSNSRWKAVASRLRSLSMSTASGAADLEGAGVAAGVLLAGVEDDEGLSDMASPQSLTEDGISQTAKESTRTQQILR